MSVFCSMGKDRSCWGCNGREIQYNIVIVTRQITGAYALHMQSPQKLRAVCVPVVQIGQGLFSAAGSK